MHGHVSMLTLTKSDLQVNCTRYNASIISHDFHVDTIWKLQNSRYVRDLFY